MNNGLNCPNQSGWKQHHSCRTALLGIVSDIQEVLSKNCLAAILMLDLSAVFDTIDHNRLLFKLENNFNITSKVLKSLQSYLVNRTFYVVVNNDHSREMPLLYGVPQGSILGPLLFILCINELNNLGEEFGLTFHSYADDTTLYIGFDLVFEFDTACQNIKCCLNKVREWMNVNFLKLIWINLSY